MRMFSVGMNTHGPKERNGMNGGRVWFQKSSRNAAFGLTRGSTAHFGQK
jgi:hypothetical protein